MINNVFASEANGSALTGSQNGTFGSLGSRDGNDASSKDSSVTKLANATLNAQASTNNSEKYAKLSSKFQNDIKLILSDVIILTGQRYDVKEKSLPKGELTRNFFLKYGPIQYAGAEEEVSRGRHRVIFAEGTEYTGEFVNGFAGGRGELKFSDVTYEGDFKKGTFHGKGILKKNDALSGDSGGIVYSGDWKYGNMDGFGKQKWLSGGLYEGHYLMGFRCGKGKFTNPNGDILDIYEGEFYLDAIVGEYKFTELNKETVIKQRSFGGSWFSSFMTGLVMFTNESQITDREKYFDAYGWTRERDPKTSKND